jgi:hypothetical protein
MSAGAAFEPADGHRTARVLVLLVGQQAAAAGDGMAVRAARIAVDAGVHDVAGRLDGGFAAFLSGRVRGFGPQLSRLCPAMW